MNAQAETKPQDFLAEVVRGDLKGVVAAADLQWLQRHAIEWKAELIRLKLSCEAQMVSSNARRFQTHKDWVSGVSTQQEYLGKINTEKAWKCNAALFLQKIETKIQQINANIA